MKYSFPAILEQDEEDKNTINVSFPDLLGVYTFANSRDEAVKMAKDALKESLLANDAYKTMTPTPIEKVKQHFKDVIMVEVEI